jgi:EthD domain
LSLAFRRHPGTSVEEFRNWWLHQHAVVATRYLLPELLAYDQVHVDRDLSRRASVSAGITFEPYDAYDNLTWATLESSIRSTSKPGSEQEIYQDEIGHLDHSTYRGAVMRVLDR